MTYHRRETTPDGRPIGWQPNSLPQSRFCSLGCFEGLYGGAAGGGKSDSLLACAMRDAEHPACRALLLRRTFPELETSLVERSRAMVPRLFPGALYNGSEHQWRFPAGGVLRFGHLQREDDVQQYQSSEWSFIGFDELTHFTERQYVYMLSRLRTPSGLVLRVRSGTNPGGPGHEWVQRRWGPWLDKDSAVKAASGEVLYYVTDDTDGERWVPRGTLDAHGNPANGRCFVAARVTDNPDIPGAYLSVLDGLDPLARAQLRDGDWAARLVGGTLFKRSFFEIVDAVPADCRWVRAWDLAATEATRESPDPDWTRGAKVGLSPGGAFFVADMASLRGTPGAVQSLIKVTASQDGKAVRVRLPQDPGQAGVDQAAAYVRLLAGYDVRCERPTGEKAVRARPASAQAEAGNVKLVRGPWNDAFLRELEAFPSAGWHDDQVDVLSDAVAELTSGSAPRAPLSLGSDIGLTRSNPWAL